MLKKIFKPKADKTFIQLRKIEKDFLDSFSSCVSFQAMWSNKAETFKANGLDANTLGVAELVTFWEQRLMREIADYNDFRAEVAASKNEAVHKYMSEGYSIMTAVNKKLDTFADISKTDVKDVLAALRDSTYRTVTTMDEMIAEAQGNWPLQTHEGNPFPPAKSLKPKR